MTLPASPWSDRSPSRVRRGLALGLLALAGATFGCGPGSEPPKPEAAPQQTAQPPALAEVNGEHLLESDFQAYLEFLGEEGEGESQESLFEQFLERKILEQAARKEGIQVSDAEVQAVLAESEEDEAPSDPRLVEQLRRFLAVQKYLQRNIDAASEIQLNELQEYYERHAEQFVQDDHLSALEILVKDRETAEKLRATLKPGDFRSFREAARRHSLGATAERGGELGPFQRGDLPKKFEDFIFALKVGEVSPVFRSELGYHIFTVDELTPRHAQKFYEVQPQIFAQMVADRERSRLEEFLRQQLDSASIRIFDDRFKQYGRESNASTQP